ADEPGRIGLRGGLDPRGLGRVLHAAPLVLAALRNQLLLLLRQANLVAELVLGDRALVLDGERTALERRAVRLLLNQLACRRAEGPLEVRLGSNRADRDADDDHADIAPPRVGGQAGIDPRA